MLRYRDRKHFSLRGCRCFLTAAPSLKRRLHAFRGDSVRDVRGDLPLIRNFGDGGSLVLPRPPRSTRQFPMTCRNSIRLPEALYVLNLSPPYRFSVALVAALLRRQVALRPTTHRSVQASRAAIPTPTASSTPRSPYPFHAFLSRGTSGHHTLSGPFIPPTRDRASSESGSTVADTHPKRGCPVAAYAEYERLPSRPKGRLDRGHRSPPDMYGLETTVFCRCRAPWHYLRAPFLSGDITETSKRCPPARTRHPRAPRTLIRKVVCRGCISWFRDRAPFAQRLPPRKTVWAPCISLWLHQAGHVATRRR